MKNPLSNQVAVVTGAGSGIGKALAIALAARGASLGLVGRRASLLESVAEVSRLAGVVARVYSADLAREGDIRTLGGSLKRDFGQIDVLIHNAAVHLMAPLVEGSAEEFDLMFRTNLLGPYLLTQELLPLILQERGQIVFINSSAGLTARANVGQFAATKHGLRAIADSLRDEINPQGVRVLSVFPGRTASPTQERIHALERRPYRPERLLQPEDVASAVVHALCLPRSAEVTQIKIRPMLKSD